MATFSTFAGGITVTLVNNDVNPTSVAENVSALVFDVSTGNGGAGSSLSSSSGLERPLLATAHSATASRQHRLGHRHVRFEHHQPRCSRRQRPCRPCATLIGNPDSSDSYSNANGSIAGNGPHNPFLANTITFNIADPAATAQSTITNVNFQFGTTDGSNLVRGIDPPSLAVPEPASLGMAGIGLASVFGYCVFGRRRRDA